MYDPTIPDPRPIYQAGNDVISRLRARRHPRVIIISGPSGVGKDAVLEQLQHHYPKAKYVVTATTRDMRPDEIDGVHYLFLTKDEFLSRIDANDFIEHASVYDNHYGVPRSPVVQGLAEGRDVIIKVDVKGHATLRRLIANTASIFIAPESTESLHEFLLNRKTESPEVLLKRLKISSEELARVDEFDYLVFNEPGRLEDTIDQICQIIEGEGRKVNQPEVIIF
ncbi:MAG: guanylate kinase [Thermomicrobiales bacterium]